MIVEAVSCFLCSATVFFVVWSGEYLYFVTPKMKYYLYFAVIVFFVWGIFEAVDSRGKGYKHRSQSYYLLLVISAFLMIACNYGKGCNIDAIDNMEMIQVVGATSDHAIIEGIRTDKKEIVVTSQNFLAWINELRTNVHQYEGYTIIVEGSMGLKRKEENQNEFYLIRWYMSCCAADVVPIGILCESEDVTAIEEESFVRVEGTVCCNHLEEGESVKIQVRKIRKVEEPKEKYIYS